MPQLIFHKIQQARHQGRKQLAVLIDPDTPTDGELQVLVKQVEKSAADYIFLGGSLLTKDVLDSSIEKIKQHTAKPVVIFPGSVLQISAKADALLFLSLISGRNPEMLIGNHVIAAPYLKQSGLEVIPTGYMLIDSGRPTTASYMSGSAPIPHNKDEIASCTALAGEMLGLKLIYMDGGSGAEQPVSTSMIKSVRHTVDAPILVGGGIRTPQMAADICRAGADIVVVGNATEKDPEIIARMADAVKETEVDAHLN